jgi:hydrogenase nickel incorporation protein HypA/HybF
MHELSIANAILDAVRQEAEKHPGARVVKVAVRIGELAGVDPEALDFGFTALVKGTELDPLALEIEALPRCNRCRQCGETFAVSDARVACPACGSAESVMVSGDELELAYLEVEET